MFDSLCRLRLNFICCMIAALGAGVAGPHPLMASEIHDAAKAGDLAKVSALVQRDSNLVSERDKEAATPLHWAVLNDHVKVAEFLLDHGADVNAQLNDGTAPLHLAAIHGFTDLAELLISRKADLGLRTTNGQTPLHDASAHGQREIAAIFIAHKANVNSTDKTGYTPLHWAALDNHREVAELLLSAGADANAKDNFDQTPLFLAAAKGSKEVVDLLLSSRVDINAAASGGLKPIDVAAKYNHPEIVALLSKYPAQLRGSGPEATPTGTNSAPFESPSEAVVHYLAAVKYKNSGWAFSAEETLIASEKVSRGNATVVATVAFKGGTGLGIQMSNGARMRFGQSITSRDGLKMYGVTLFPKDGFTYLTFAETFLLVQQNGEWKVSKASPTTVADPADTPTSPM